MANTYESKYGITYEVSLLPFWGPRRRAKEALETFDGTRLQYEEFIGYFRNRYTEYFEDVEWMRFHSFSVHEKGDQHYRIVVISTSPSIKARVVLFEERNTITRDTGWYPLVMGSRAGFHRRRIGIVKEDDIGTIGRFNHLKVIANSNRNGVSFEIGGKNGGYLLDFGFRINTEENYKAYFLSHVHGDHSTGIFHIARQNIKNKYPVISSKTGASFLRYRLESQKALRPFIKNVVHTGFKKRLHLEDGSVIDLFRVYHSPGSIGYRFQDTFGHSVYYLGDVCLKNGFSDYRDELFDFIERTRTNTNSILLDGTMVNRDQFIDKEDIPEKLLIEYSRNSSKRNVVFFSNQPEHSIYSYLNVFRFTQQVESLSRMKLLVSESLFRTLRLLIEPIILGHDTYRDPVYEFLYGKSKANPVGSHRLYPLSEKILNDLPDNENVIIFSGVKDINRLPSLKKRFYKSDVVLSGTFALRDNLPRELVITKPRSIVRVASEDWGFHSHEEVLAEFIHRISGRDMKIYLFHNHQAVLQDFITKNNFDTNCVIAMSNEEEIYHI